MSENETSVFERQFALFWASLSMEQQRGFMTKTAKRLVHEHLHREIAQLLKEEIARHVDLNVVRETVKQHLDKAITEGLNAVLGPFIRELIRTQQTAIQVRLGELVKAKADMLGKSIVDAIAQIKV